MEITGAEQELGPSLYVLIQSYTFCSESRPVLPLLFSPSLSVVPRTFHASQLWALLALTSDKVVLFVEFVLGYSHLCLCIYVLYVWTHGRGTCAVTLVTSDISLCFSRGHFFFLSSPGQSPSIQIHWLTDHIHLSSGVVKCASLEP